MSAPGLDAVAGQARHDAGEPRSRRRGSGRIDLLAVGLLIVLAATAYSIYALRVGSFQNDEEQYLQLARYVAAQFPHVLWQGGIYLRGTQRLDPIVLAIPFALMRGPGAYQLAHVIQCLLFASTALPVYLLARRAGTGPLAGLFAATLCVVVPWSVVSTSFLAESMAYPAYAWALYAICTAIQAPGIRRELGALVALALAALSRTALLALIPVLPLAVLWQVWGWELRGIPLPRRLRELPLRLWSRHRLLSAAFALGIVVYLLDALGLLPGRGLASLAGEYGLPQIEAISSLLARYRVYLSRVSAGTGFIALALALPWTVATLVRARDGAQHALAVVCTLGLGAVLLSLLKGGPDERYVMYGAVPVALAAAAALRAASGPTGRLGRPAAAGLLAGTVVVVLLIDSVSWPAPVSPYDYFSFPAAVFYRQVIIGRLASTHLPLLHPGPERLVELGLLAVAVVLVVLGRRWVRAGTLAVVLGASMIVLCATGTIYAMHKFTNGAGEALGATARERSWVDETVPAGARVARFGVSEGETPNYFAIWRATAFWNTSVNIDLYTDVADPLPIFLGDAELHIDAAAASGLLTMREPTGREPPSSFLKYLLIPRQGTNRLGIDGRILAQDPYLPLTLLEPSRPLRLDWSLEGTGSEAFMSPGTPVVASVYPAALLGPGPRCATLALIGTPHYPGSWPYTVSIAGRVLARGSLPSQQTRQIVVPLPRSSPTSPAALKLTTRVHGQVLYAGSLLSAQFANFAVAQCPTRAPGAATG